jgi:hypothetical protein
MKIKFISFFLLILLILSCSEKQSFVLKEEPPEINIDDVIPIDPMIRKGVLDNTMVFLKIVVNYALQSMQVLSWRMMISRVWPISLNIWHLMVQRILRNMN